MTISPGLFKNKIGDMHYSEDEKKALVWNCIVMQAMKEKGLKKWECLNAALNSWDWLLLDGMLRLCLQLSLQTFLQISHDHLACRFNTALYIPTEPDIPTNALGSFYASACHCLMPQELKNTTHYRLKFRSTLLLDCMYSNYPDCMVIGCTTTLLRTWVQTRQCNHVRQIIIPTTSEPVVCWHRMLGGISIA